MSKKLNIEVEYKKDKGETQVIVSTKDKKVVLTPFTPFDAWLFETMSEMNVIPSTNTSLTSFEFNINGRRFRYFKREEWFTLYNKSHVDISYTHTKEVYEIINNNNVDGFWSKTSIVEMSVRKEKKKWSIHFKPTNGGAAAIFKFKHGGDFKLTLDDIRNFLMVNYDNDIILKLDDVSDVILDMRTTLSLDNKTYVIGVE